VELLELGFARDVSICMD